MLCASWSVKLWWFVKLVSTLERFEEQKESAISSGEWGLEVEDELNMSRMKASSQAELVCPLIFL